MSYNISRRTRGRKWNSEITSTSIAKLTYVLREKIYATILYYLANKEEVEVYLERERLMDEEAGKLIKAYGENPTAINWEERLEEARQRLIAEGKYPLTPGGPPN